MRGPPPPPLVLVDRAGSWIVVGRHVRDVVAVDSELRLLGPPNTARVISDIDATVSGRFEGDGTVWVPSHLFATLRLVLRRAWSETAGWGLARSDLAVGLRAHLPGWVAVQLAGRPAGALLRATRRPHPTRPASVAGSGNRLAWHLQAGRRDGFDPRAFGPELAPDGEPL